MTSTVRVNGGNLPHKPDSKLKGLFISKLFLVILAALAVLIVSSVLYILRVSSDIDKEKSAYESTLSTAGYRLFEPHIPYVMFLVACIVLLFAGTFFVGLVVPVKLIPAGITITFFSILIASIFMIGEPIASMPLQEWAEQRYGIMIDRDLTLLKNEAKFIYNTDTMGTFHGLEDGSYLFYDAKNQHELPLVGAK